MLIMFCFCCPGRVDDDDADDANDANKRPSVSVCAALSRQIETQPTGHQTDARNER